MQANKQFDEWIRARLSNLEAPYDPASWDELEARLDLEQIIEFDQAIANKLGAIEAEAANADWEAFSRKLEIEEAAESLAPEDPIDAVVLEKIGDLRVPLQPTHWQLMAMRLEEIFVLRQRIFRQKVAEAALMVLLLLALIRFQPVLTSVSDTDLVIAPGQSESLQLERASEASQANQLQVPQETNVQAGRIEKGALESRVAAPKPTTPVVGAESERAPEEVLPGEDSHSTTELAGRPQRRALDVPNLLSGRISRPVLEPELPALGVKGMAAKRFDATELPVEWAAVEALSSPALILPKVKRNLPLETQVRFSLLGTIDYNIINTPPDRFEFQGTYISTEADTTAASGYGGGILIGFKRGRWDLQTGGIYSFKRYIPNTPVVVFQTVNYYVQEDFHGIQQDILQVPLQLNYYFKNQGYWNLYGGVGVSAHFVTSSVYEFRYRYTPTFNLAVPTPPSESTPSIRQEKDFPKGLFDGGSLSDNLYLSANIGLGLERYLYAGRMSIFLEPNYQHYLFERGIGTNHDKIYTLSLYLGTRLSFK